MSVGNSCLLAHSVEYLVPLNIAGLPLAERTVKGKTPSRTIKAVLNLARSLPTAIAEEYQLYLIA